MHVITSIQEQLRDKVRHEGSTLLQQLHGYLSLLQEASFSSIDLCSEVVVSDIKSVCAQIQQQNENSLLLVSPGDLSQLAGSQRTHPVSHLQ